ncbi:MAG: type II secretion system protein GspK [Verrucomicrobia bacterium]|jgi:general secretion pathway protein K|nr:type II secretion system protein GspK [Verrucomicrobiota bacterium]MDA1203684.1 type II secretion system protein GspK [Verrucomicrobiota bacterium]
MTTATHPSGAALLLVLWAITVISFSVLWMANVVNLELETTVSDSAGLTARQIAVSGVALGLHPQVKRDDTELLNRDLGAGERMEVRIRGEGARFNLNRLLKDQDRITMLNLFTLWGLTADEGNALIDKLTDWVDEDEFRTGFGGAERTEYEAVGITDAPANRPFRSVPEMGRVLDMEKLAALKPDWAESFTIFGDGLIDVNEAEADVLQAVTGATPEMVQGILQQRRGSDEIEPSEDDLRFDDVGQVAGWLAGSTLPLEQIMGRLTTESSVKRIDSRGVVGERSRRISVVAASGEGGETATYLLWEEK